MAQVSVGTLLAFTVVALSVLILRYVPPDELPLPSSLQGRIDSVSFICGETNSSDHVGTSNSSKQPLIGKNDASVHFPVIEKQESQGCCKLHALRDQSAFFHILFSKFFLGLYACWCCNFFLAAITSGLSYFY